MHSVRDRTLTAAEVAAIKAAWHVDGGGDARARGVDVRTGVA